MTDVTPRWPLGSWKRIAHGLACIAGFELWQVFAFGILFGVLQCSPADLWKGDPVFIATSVVSGTLAMACVVWLGIVRMGRVSWRDLDWHTEQLWLSLGLGVLGTALLSTTLLGLLAASGRLTQIDVVAEIGAYTASQRLLFFAIGVSAAAIEESIFRGYLQPALIAKTGLIGGILTVAVIFALYHVFMGPSWFILLGKVLIGIVLGALRGRSNSLVAPLLAHFAFWQIFGSL
jgi:membrane protease YdiL (CAAX protease family)